MPSALLTDVFLRNIATPETLTEYWDQKVAGLCLRVTPRGVKTWTFRYRPKDSNSFKRLPLGHYPETGLSLARERAQARRVEVSGGADPQGERQAKKDAAAQALTFDALADAYLERYAKIHKSSWRNDELLLAAHVRPVWGGRSAEKITRGDAAQLLDAIAAKTPASANRTQSILSKAFNWGLESGLVAVNPLSRMKKRGRETAKDRVLSPGEIRLLWRVIGQGVLSPAVAAALHFILLTGLRPGEAAGLEIGDAKELNVAARARIEIPAARMKGGKAHIVPLAPMALEIVREQINCRCEGQGHIFPSHFIGKGAIARHSLSQGLRRLIDGIRSADDDDVEAIASLRANPPTPHDFRRTVATGLAALGVPREDRMAILAHAQGDVHGLHYDKYDRLKEKRAALEKWEDHLAQIIAPAPAAANVVPLGRRK